LLDDEMLDEVEPAPVPTDAALRKISVLADRYLMLECDIADLADALAKKQAALKAVREVDLPTAMAEAGTRRFDLTDGSVVKLEEGVGAHITEANKPKAHAWLEDHGHGAIVKHQITILFGKGEEDWAKKFIRDCKQRKKQLNLERKDSVHSQTLGKFIRDQAEQAKQDQVSLSIRVPYDLFGVHEYRYATVERKS
jgi:hypothetical protein